MLVDMTTNEDVYPRSILTETVLHERDWSLEAETRPASGAVLTGLRRRLAALFNRRSTATKSRPSRPTRRLHRADFMERAAMSREMHRL